MEVTNRFGNIGRINVRHEPKIHIPFAVMLEGFISHHWSEIRTTDTNVHDTADTFSGVTFPRAAPDAIRKLSHLFEDLVNLAHHVLSVNDNRSLSRGAQSYV